jgi:Arc/MetJ-type ribon-helix-helix transcriptional regulator
MSTTTVRVRSETRDAITRRAQARHQTADEVIAAGLAALEQLERRAQARADAQRLAADERNEAEVAAAQRDLDTARAW